MRKRFSISSLHKILGHEAASSEVVHSHAFGKVARSHRPIPKTRHASSLSRGSNIASYKDSMVGSTVQYRDNTPLPPREVEKEKEAQPNERIVGNRPQSKTIDKKTEDASPKRHHFIEPPKPTYNRYD